MRVIENGSGNTYKVEIVSVLDEDFKAITQERYWFDWSEEKEYNVYKLLLKGSKDVLGLVSLEVIESESRIAIRLLAASKENRGKDKKYRNIVGCLIAFAGKQSIKIFGEWACISLIPKTVLKEYYKQKYLMLEAGKSLFLDGNELLDLIKKYDYE